MKEQLIFILIPVFIFISGYVGKAQPEPGVILTSEFVYQKNDVPFPSCHASTIAETIEGLVVAWFGGTNESNKDVGIWLSRQVKGNWTKPVEVANGIQNDHLRYPAWNPVLYSAEATLVLFYKVGPSPSTWWGEMKRSDDWGKTWGKGVALPKNIYGPIKNKPLDLRNGRVLFPSSTEDNGWCVHMEWTDKRGGPWQRTTALNSGDTLPAIQPTLLLHPGGRLQMLCRTKKDHIYTAWSDDQGETWTTLKPLALPNNNSGIDAVTLQDGKHLLVYNPTDQTHDRGARNRLSLAVSSDGLLWKEALILENDADVKSEYSYPAIIQDAHGLVHITYTWKRELIRHLVIDPEKLN